MFLDSSEPIYESILFSLFQFFDYTVKNQIGGSRYPDLSKIGMKFRITRLNYWIEVVG